MATVAICGIFGFAFWPLSVQAPSYLQKCPRVGIGGLQREWGRRPFCSYGVDIGYRLTEGM